MYAYHFLKSKKTYFNLKRGFKTLYFNMVDSENSKILYSKTNDGKSLFLTPEGELLLEGFFEGGFNVGKSSTVSCGCPDLQ